MVDTIITGAEDIVALISSDAIPVGRSSDSVAYFTTMAEVATYVDATIPSTLTHVNGPLTVGVPVTTEGKILLAAHKAGDAPVYLYNTNASFAGYEETIIALGYNMGGEIASHHKFFMAFETDYKYSSTPDKFASEWYIQLNNTLNTHSIRPFFCSVDRDSLAGANYYAATTHIFNNVDGTHNFWTMYDGTPPSNELTGATIHQITNNMKWLYQNSAGGTAISLIWLDNTGVIVVGQSGYPIVGQDDFQIYNSAKGFVLADRSDGHYYRIKCTAGVLGTEIVA